MKALLRSVKLQSVTFTLALTIGEPQVTQVRAAVTVFQDDLAGFNGASGSPPVALDFDSIATGTDIAGSAISGVTCSSPDGNTLPVVTAASTFSPSGFIIQTGDLDNRLFATSGANVLSPGGAALVPGPALAEKDSLRLVFTTPVKAFGVDVLFQSEDGNSSMNFELRDASNAMITNGPLLIPALPNGSDNTSPASSGGAFFIGFVSSSPDIARVDFIELDGNAEYPDSNVGYDTLRFVPEPNTAILVGMGLLSVMGLGWKKARS
jgi:hypothetical protein